MSKYVFDGRLCRPVQKTAFARASLVGNPSDLLRQAEARAKKENNLDITIFADGAVLSIPIKSFVATATIAPTEHFSWMAPTPRYSTLGECVDHIRLREPGSWEIIIERTLVVVDDMLRSSGKKMLEIPMEIHLTTNIPRQRGTSGSSGMILSLIEALLTIHGADKCFDTMEKAIVAWKIETDGGTEAGLQDRVLQAAAIDNPKTTAVFMEFPRTIRDGSCQFKVLETQLPQLALVLSSEPSYSGGVHKPIVDRLIAGDRSLAIRFHQLGEYAYSARNCLEAGDWSALGILMNKTSLMRIEIYGQDVLGPINMALFEACNAAHCQFNFTGSGGAVVVLLLNGDQSYQKLKTEVAKRGNFTIYRL